MNIRVYLAVIDTIVNSLIFEAFFFFFFPIKYRNGIIRNKNVITVGVYSAFIILFCAEVIFVVCSRVGLVGRCVTRTENYNTRVYRAILLARIPGSGDKIIIVIYTEFFGFGYSFFLFFFLRALYTRAVSIDLRIRSLTAARIFSRRMRFSKKHLLESSH